MRIKRIKRFLALGLIVASLFMSMTLLGCSAKVSELSLDISDVKTMFLSNDTFNCDGIKVTAKYSDGETKEIPISDCEVKKPALAPYGKKEVNISYGGASATYEIYSALYTSDEDNEAIIYTLRQGVVMTSYLIGENKPFVLVLPGGGYTNVAESVEGIPYAKKINELGFNAFVLRYSVMKPHPAPLDDVALAVELIMANTDFFEVSGENYAVCGSSAGGHLAATWSTKVVGYEHYGLPKPSAAILCYTSTHISEGGRSNLLGDNPSEELRKSLSADENVDGDYPAVYSWVFVEDTSAYNNREYLKAALEKHKIPNVFRAFTGGEHGLGLAIGTEAEGWIDEAIEFWQEHSKD